MDGSVSPTWFWSSESEATPYSGLKLIHIYASVHPSCYLLSPSVSMLIPVSLLIQFSPFLLFQDIQYITSVCVLISNGNWCRVSVLMDILCQGTENTTAKGCRTFYTFMGVSATLFLFFFYKTLFKMSLVYLIFHFFLFKVLKLKLNYIYLSKTTLYCSVNVEIQKTKLLKIKTKWKIKIISKTNFSDSIIYPKIHPWK